MNHIEEIYHSALAIIEQRGQKYGGVEDNFMRAAVIASMKLNTQISPYDVAIIMESVKDARRAVDPGHADSHIDGINYKAFAMMLAPIKAKKENPVPPPAAPSKRKPGRPPKVKGDAPAPSAPPVKRGRGRPKKVK